MRSAYLTHRLSLAIAVAVACIAACGTTTQTTAGPSADAPRSEFNAGVGRVFKPSERRGGTLRFANSGDWDSLDPANTYYTYAWNFLRLYGRSLVMFASAPGAQGARLVPDLAQSLGIPSDGGRTWTYKLRPGVLFEDGEPVTSKDVKYAVERYLDKTTFPNGPTYLNDVLDMKGYITPYHDADPDRLGLTAIETPNPHTLVFHLNKPFSAFDYLAQLPATVPVPRAKDTGTKYKEHVLSTGPYMFESNEPGKQFTLVRNPKWSPATDPHRRALPDKILVQLNVDVTDIDNRLLSGDLDAAVEGAGVGAQAQHRILSNPSLKAHSDSTPVAREWYTAVNSDVVPLGNVHCRRAVQYATDRKGYQNAYGGPVGGDIATNLLPPVIPGTRAFDLYGARTNPGGDLAKAKSELALCGQPNGFTTKISYPAERRADKAAAEALQRSLGRVGIATTINPYPLSDYFTLYAGNPRYAKDHNLGLIITGWNADWPDGFGFLSQIVDSRVIRASGNSNLSVRDLAVDRLIDRALVTTDPDARQALWVEVDKAVMRGAYIVPGVWAKGLLFRPNSLTNVFVTDGFQMYDYLALGVTR